MNRLKQLPILFLLVITVMSLQVSAKPHTIFADNELLQYTGRIDFSAPKAPKISWPGTYIKARFTGDKLSVLLDDEFGHNYFNVFIDEDWDNPVVIRCSKGLATYVISEKLTQGPHSLMISKRTEGEEGNTVFKGLVLAGNGKLLPPAPRPSRRIEFIGDSVTSGMGNEAPQDQDDDKLAEKNNFLAYGAMTARNLDAEYVSTSQSGIGIMVSWFDFTMPKFFLQLNATGLNNSRWDFNQWAPDVAVINLFQNDHALADIRLTPVPDDEARIQAYYRFLKTVRGKYPETLIIATLGSMDAVKPGSKWPGYIQQAITRIKAETGDKQLMTMMFPYTGYDKHPRVQHHRENAALLTKFIRQQMSW
ncbi:electron transporter RnfD [Thalassomonas sp. RHCl1]|uniref:electron transporter RnfD n=1 Tax=Thalassomonas sp. RHCl1 TaxID=2995320 RepID=UPI00248C6666|nr:electron transporter RnfD [Thalassomonas sp. RHCl1]